MTTVKLPKNMDKWDALKVERWLQNNVNSKFTAHSFNEYVSVYYSDHPNIYFRYKGATWKEAVMKAVAAYNCTQNPHGDFEDTDLTQQEENKLKESNTKI